MTPTECADGHSFSDDDWRYFMRSNQCERWCNRCGNEKQTGTYERLQGAAGTRVRVGKITID